MLGVTVLSPLASGPQVAQQCCLVVEDQPDSAAWLARVTASAFPDTSVETAANLREANRWLDDRLSEPGPRLRLALIDLGLPDGSGVEFIRRLSVDAPEAIAVVATIYDGDTHLFESITAGAQGYVLKQEGADVIADRLQRIDQGEPALSPSIARRILERVRAETPRAYGPADLTARETQVLALLARGLTIAEAAATLGLKPQTVASYVKVIYEKVGVSNRAGAAIAAANRGLI